MYRQHYPDDPGMHNIGDQHTRVTYRRNETFCQRVKNSLIAVIVGIFLITASISLLFWNEGRAVQTSRSLDEGLQKVLQLKSTEVAFEEHNHKLVHITAPLKTTEVLYDKEYGVALKAVRLHRKVEMYQWVEHSHTKEVREGEETRQETTYTYSMEWRTDVIRSSSFSNPTGHHNPSDMAISSKLYSSQDTQVGNFYISKDLSNKVNNYRQFSPQEVPSGLDAELHDGIFYHGTNYLKPEVGDIRVKFEFAGLSGNHHHLGSADVVSIVAMQSGNELTAYQTDAGDVLQFLYIGELTAEQIFGREIANNAFMTWAVRFAGWLIMFIGFGCLTKIFITLVDWLPIVRELVAMGIMTLNVTFAVSLSLTVIAVAWIFYRPWLGFTILFCSLLPFIINLARARSRTQPWPRTNRPFED